MGTLPAFSVGANPNPITVIQPDGSTIQIRVRGDERNRWASTTDGYQVVKNSKGYYEYAVALKSGSVAPSGQRASNVVQRTVQEKAFLSRITAQQQGDVTLKAAQSLLKSASVGVGAKSAALSATVSGQFKLLVVLANYSDTQTRYSSEAFGNMMNQTNYNGTGSFRDYYLENSNGGFDVVSTVTTWVTVPKSHNYYGPEAKWGEFAFQAIKAAYNGGVNLSQFDNDGNGVVDAIAIIHQGHGQEATDDSTDIWSHSWTLSDAGYSSSQRTFGSVKVDKYIVQPELNGAGSEMASIGVVAHEFGHVLGANDYYDTDYKTNGEQAGTGTWDLMADGCYNGKPTGSSPAHHNAYTKLQFGWAQSQLLTEPMSVVAPPVVSSRTVYRYNTKTDNEYFLLENRVKTGFDSYLMGEGLIVYHVDGNYITKTTEENTVNTSAHQGMFVVAAGAEVNDASCPFPGSNSVNAFHDKTTPSSVAWSGEATDKSVTNIVLLNDTVHFDFMALQDGLPKTFGAVLLNETQVELTWQKRVPTDSLMIAYSTTNVFGTPVDGASYNVGDVIEGGGGVILVSADLSSFVHSVDWQSTYYYRIWANKGTRYSTYMDASVNGWRQIAFYLNNVSGEAVADAEIECDSFVGKTSGDGYLMFYGDFPADKLHRYVVRKEGYEEKWGVFSSEEPQSIYVDMLPLAQWSDVDVKAAVDNKKVTLTWNPVVDESFSAYTPFSISLDSWLLYDNDKLSTYGINGIDFTNEGYTGSFIVFDGYADGLIDQGMAIESLSGRQFLASIAVPKPANRPKATNDDWLISPEISAGPSTWLSFFASSATDKYGLERLKVLVSTTGSSIGSFKKINDGNYLEVPDGWTFYKYDLSAYDGQKVRFALNCVSDTAFMLMLDRIQITGSEPSEPVFSASRSAGLKSTSTTASPLKILGTKGADRTETTSVTGPLKSTSSEENLTGSIHYEITRNGVAIGVVDGFSAVTFPDVTDGCGTQTYTVKAVDVSNGNLKESQSLVFQNCLTASLVAPNPSEGVFGLQLPDGANNVSYWVYNVSGQMVTSGKSDNFRFDVDISNMPQGTYFLRMVHEKGSETVKIFKK